MRELLRAVLTGKPIFAMLEPEANKGGLSVEQVRSMLAAADELYEGWGLAAEVRNWAANGDVTSPAPQGVALSEHLYEALLASSPLEGPDVVLVAHKALATGLRFFYHAAGRFPRLGGIDFEKTTHLRALTVKELRKVDDDWDLDLYVYRPEGHTWVFKGPSLASPLMSAVALQKVHHIMLQIADFVLKNPSNEFTMKAKASENRGLVMFKQRVNGGLMIPLYMPNGRGLLLLDDNYAPAVGGSTPPYLIQLAIRDNRRFHFDLSHAVIDGMEWFKHFLLALWNMDDHQIADRSLSIKTGNQWNMMSPRPARRLLEKFVRGRFRLTRQSLSGLLRALKCHPDN